VRGAKRRTEILEPTIRYYPETDTMAIEIRPWPDGADGQPRLWEIERALAHSEHIAAALGRIRRRSAVAASLQARIKLRLLAGQINELLAARLAQ